MKQIIKKQIAHVVYIVIAVITLVIPTSAGAQIKYDTSGLIIGPGEKHYLLNMTIKDMSGFYWSFNDHFFTFDLTPSNPRLSGNGDEVVFYNTTKKAYNSIRVANVYNYSDARAKTNIENFEGGLGAILSLRPVTYNWKSPSQSSRESADMAAADTTSMGPQEENNKQYGFLPRNWKKCFLTQ